MNRSEKTSNPRKRKRTPTTSSNSSSSSSNNDSENVSSNDGNKDDDDEDDKSEADEVLSLPTLAELKSWRSLRDLYQWAKRILGAQLALRFEVSKNLGIYTYISICDT